GRGSGGPGGWARALGSPPRRPRGGSGWRTPPRLRSSRVPADPNESRKTAPLLRPKSQETSGTNCVSKGSSPPTRRCPSTGNSSEFPKSKSKRIQVRPAGLLLVHGSGLGVLAFNEQQEEL